MSGSFNLIKYTREGRAGIVRRLTLQRAISEAEKHSTLEEFNYASVRRVPDGKGIGLALKGQFRFDGT